MFNTSINNFKQSRFKHISKGCIIVAPAKTGTPMTIKRFSNFKHLTDEFGTEDVNYPLTAMAKVLFLNNVHNVYCIAPSINSTPSLKDYIEAFKLLQHSDGFYSIVCGSEQPSVIAELTKSINSSPSFNSAKLAFAYVAPETPYDEIRGILHPKLVLTNSKTYLSSNEQIAVGCLSAAAFAACINSANGTLAHLNSLPIFGLALSEPKQRCSELLHNSKLGISSLTEYKNYLKVFHLATSKPINPNFEPDINISFVLDSITTDLTYYLQKIKNTPYFNFISKDSLASQIIVFLTYKQKIGLINGFEMPIVEIDSSINIKLTIILHLYSTDYKITKNISI